MGASCAKHEVTPVVGASAAAPPDEPKTFNEMIIAAIRAHILRILEPKDRDADG